MPFQTDDMTFDDSEEYRICSDCIDERYLKMEVDRIGELANCSYCGAKGNTITIEELADHVEKAFEDHYQRTSTEMTGLEWIAHKDPESTFEWERHGDPVCLLIQGEVGIEEKPAEHICHILCERNYDFDMAAAGKENPFDEEAHYEEKDVSDHELQQGWVYFQKSLKTETRLFNREAESILDFIFEGITDHTTYRLGSVIVKAGPGRKISKLYRARVFQNDDNLEKALIRPDLEIGPPPFSAASAGRINAKGISVFYGATNEKVALTEVRPPVGSRVAIGLFEIIRPIRLLDVEKLRSIYVKGSLFDPTFIRKLEKAKFLETLSDHITMPVMPDDEAADYLVTQAIADYLSNRTSPELDGIIYRSIQNGNKGRNIALFHKSSRVEVLNIPEGSEFRAYLGMTTEDGRETDYTVIELEPEKPSKPRIKRKQISVFDPIEFSTPYHEDMDIRPTTLKIDADSMKVHHIQSVKVSSSSYSVSRYKSDRRKNKF
ncbi:MAG: RES domain-containing protein [Candidatus Thiodiazotropha sp. (ex Lucina aurantia)]|nr:RES domain-containing protein [Candidatus Thiodiazotropha sp. (ex Lucina pensylvanica)]MBT3024689.1 RES domain-containing protein [Candidatus Thiodiazotropha taylori]MBV2098825.1 RES domain-containing protein [Candidatus Thiodiazotropha sp. (ex Codakia orbicularis)]MBV2103859.1 RES domain-containing protein [Candidatus Thiodiazotropha sp. (ex Lucina aurantia)]MBV2118270.1 RES domain-containing protein [Candidatus Thiodiazotropha sp. (ex Lucina aurantia)]